MTVLIIGGTGTTGTLLATMLRAENTPVRTAARSSNADVPFDWSDPRTHRAALQGVRAVYLVPPVGDAHPARLVEPFLARAVSAGVERVVLLSATAVTAGTPGPGQLPSLVSGALAEWAILRPTWFASNFLGDHLHARSIASRGEVVSATGEGRVPFIDPGDIAAVAARALTSPRPLQCSAVLTGPTPLSFDDVATVLTQVRGRAVRHRRVSEVELAEHLHRDGVPRDFAMLLASMDTSISRGSEDRTTDSVQRLTGQPPRAFGDYVVSGGLRSTDRGDHA